MPPTTPYILIAISNVTRASSFRQVATESLGLESVLVRDGADALQVMAKRGSPALLIVDLSLPRMDGFTIVRRLRRAANEHQTRVIVVSAHESLRNAARQLAPTLGLSGILGDEDEPAALRELIFAGLDPARQTPPAARTPAPEQAQAAKAVASDPEDIVERAAVEIRRRLKLPVSIGYLRLGNDESLTFHVGSRTDQPVLAVDTLIDTAVLRQAALASEPLVVPNVEQHPVFATMSGVDGKSARGFAAVPIVSSREQVRAALCVVDRTPLALSASDIDNLAAFGRQVGAELDRVTLVVPDRTAASYELPEDVEALQHLAATDPLTGVANRRGGERHIANEISRAKREKRPLSCILIDIDRFKQVNDTYGHQAGDQLLRDVSALLRRTVRAYDILVRWGGEEFLLVLPGVGIDVARSLADRLRAAVEALDTHGIGPVTVSAGAAEFENDYDFASTLRTADRRLYQAKAAGRNCIV